MGGGQQADAARLHLAEQWREKLLSAAEADVEDLLAAFPWPDAEAAGRPELEKLLQETNSSPIVTGILLSDLIKRPELSYALLAPLDKDRALLPEAVTEQAEIAIRYEGYIKRQQQQVEQFEKLEAKKLPQPFDYAQIRGLRLEAIQKLNNCQPDSVGRASRISGVNPADVSVLLIYFKMV